MGGVNESVAIVNATTEESMIDLSAGMRMIALLYVKFRFLKIITE
jgi:hypothetical protein